MHTRIPTKLTQYLDRIHFEDSPALDLATLSKIHHQHLCHIPYENIDVQLQLPLDFDINRIFTKLVTHARGGWCYEMNGLLGWALKEIGFEVQRMSGAVMRAEKGQAQLGNHLVLEVRLDQPYLVDVGLGDGIREPIPLVQGSHTQGGLEYALEQLNDGYWRFHNHAYSNISSYDFLHETADESELLSKCKLLQSDPSSLFRKLLIAQRFTPQGIHVQVGRISTFIDETGRSTQIIDNLDTLHTHLAATFGLNVNLTPVWSKICKAHEQLMSSTTD